ncbi:MAG: holo-ACP synthase [Oscillospiraceae bacterium]|nr:holo-ACP synthase [Oscillospiraceae bacterium]
MIKTGIDLLEIERMRKSAKNPRFVSRFFAESEIEYFNTLPDPAPSMAANFSAKEALGKALGIGIFKIIPAGAAVLRNKAGEPYFEFSGKTLACTKKSGFKFSVSLTHTKTTAGAIVIAYK